MLARDQRRRALTDLPIEVLQEIVRHVPETAAGSVLDKSPWCAVALLCKLVNEITTPLIYAEIVIKSQKTSNYIQCFRTLASCARLASLVRSLDLLHRPPSSPMASFDSTWTLYQRVVDSMDDMSSLRHLVIDFKCHPNIADALARVAPTLESLHVYVFPEYFPPESVDRRLLAVVDAQLAALHLHFPRLRTFSMSLSRCSDSLQFFLQEIVNCSPKIQNLAVSAWDDEAVPILFSPETDWASLQTLEATMHTISSIPISSTQTVRSLKILGSCDEPPVIDDRAFPLLQSLEGGFDDLLHFFSRPTYPLPPSEPFLPGAAPSASHIHCREPTIKRLTIQLKSLSCSWADVPCAAPTLLEVESLTLELRQVWTIVDGLKNLGRVFVRLPRLTEFSLGGVDRPTRDTCAYSEQEQLTLILDWKERCPHLRRVCLFDRHEWSKKTSSLTQGEKPELWYYVKLQ